MNFALPQAYLLGLIVLLGVVSVVVGRQVLRVRKQEGQLASLERRCQDPNADAASLYELGSVQLDKRLFAQAASSLKRAAKLSASEPAETGWPMSMPLCQDLFLKHRIPNSAVCDRLGMSLGLRTTRGRRSKCLLPCLIARP